VRTRTLRTSLCNIFGTTLAGVPHTHTPLPGRGHGYLGWHTTHLLNLEGLPSSAILCSSTRNRRFIGTVLNAGVLNYAYALPSCGRTAILALPSMAALSTTSQRLSLLTYTSNKPLSLQNSICGNAGWQHAGSDWRLRVETCTAGPQRSDPPPWRQRTNRSVRAASLADVHSPHKTRHLMALEHGAAPA